MRTFFCMSRKGQLWSEQEQNQLLIEIQKKIPIEMIAELHERTSGAINSKLRSIAADYYFYNEMSIDKIQKFTGLSIETISDAISKREYEIKQKEERGKRVKESKTKERIIQQEQKEELSDTKEIISLLKDIKGLLQEFLNNIHYEQ